VRILFVNGQAFLPQLVGGVEVSTLSMCSMLSDLGHSSSIMARVRQGDLLWFWNKVRGNVRRELFPVDDCHGVPVYRGGNPVAGMPEVMRKVRPDAVIVQSVRFDAFKVCAESLRQNVPTFFYVHDANAISVLKNQAPPLGLRFIANSRFTEALVRRGFRRDCEVLPPAIVPKLGEAAASAKSVVMINPRPLKGGEIAVEVARRCGDIPFLFVEAWSGRDADIRSIRQYALSLANVTWLPVQKDMSAIYGASRLLLVPSQCPETWGMIVTEAHHWGIPVVASRLGALPDTVGPGGLLVDADADIDEWVEAVRQLWDNPTAHRAYAKAALEYARRDEIDPASIARKLVRIVQAQ